MQSEHMIYWLVVWCLDSEGTEDFFVDKLNELGRMRTRSRWNQGSEGTRSSLQILQCGRDKYL